MLLWKTAGGVNAVRFIETTGARSHCAQVRMVRIEGHCQIMNQSKHI